MGLRFGDDLIFYLSIVATIKVTECCEVRECYLVATHDAGEVCDS